MQKNMKTWLPSKDNECKYVVYDEINVMNIYSLKKKCQQRWRKCIKIIASSKESHRLNDYCLFDINPLSQFYCYKPMNQQSPEQIE